MMNRWLIYWTFCFFTLASPILFANRVLPEWLLFQGKPIDPLCFFEQGVSKKSVDLNRCGINKEEGRRISGHNQILEDKGFTGFEYGYAVPGQGVEMQGYSYYKPYGLAGNSGIIETINNGGGTGEFTALLSVKRRSNQLTIDVLNSGDRCNGGIVWVKRQQDAQGILIKYGVNLTSFDVLTLLGKPPMPIKAYEDIASCAICCKAIAVYQRRALTRLHRLSNEQLDYVDLSSYPIKEPDGGINLRFQACFNRILEAYKKRFNKRLKPDQLRQFVDEFNARCVKSSKLT